MLSEFEVPKPEQEFNQIILESDEVFIEDLRVTLQLYSDWSISGKLNLCSRSLIFQPRDEKLPLIKFKLCDGLQIKSGKFTLDFMVNELGEKYEEFIANLRRTLKNPIGRRGTEEPAPVSSSKGLSYVIKIKKLAIYERSLPAPYSVEIFNGFFLFKVELSSKSRLLGGSAQAMLEEMLRVQNSFERMLERVRRCEDEQRLIEELEEERFARYKAKRRQKEFLTFMYSCRIIETFESFFGAISLSDKGRTRVKGLLNLTKKVGLRFTLKDVKWLTLYEINYKKTAIEFFFFTSSQSLLLDFSNEKSAEKIYRHYKEKCPGLIDVQLEELTKTWVNNLMGNFDYLMYLNRLSNRSFNDASRYPIFPWVVSDFFSEEFKLNSKSQYRDLSKPLHALHKSRETKSRETYQVLQRDTVPTKKPFHYPIFPSTPGSVVYFYMRAVPSLIIKLQSEAFGTPDRIFRGFETLWSQMHSGHMHFIELIPELYSVNKSDLLRNKFGLEFGTSNEGEEINDVMTAKWAFSLQDFMFKMRAALESEHCSLHLNAWIDLFFGVGQRGEPSLQAANVYSETSYSENVDFSNIKSKLKTQALKTQVQQFGQLPNQLFSFAHPRKKIKAQLISEQRSSSNERKVASNNYIVKLTSNKQMVENQKKGGQRSRSQLNNSRSDGINDPSELIDKLNIIKLNFDNTLSQADGGHQDQDFSEFNQPDSQILLKSDFDLNG